jgi:hypothetical protein
VPIAIEGKINRDLDIHAVFELVAKIIKCRCVLFRALDLYVNTRAIRHDQVNSCGATDATLDADVWLLPCSELGHLHLQTRN